MELAANGKGIIDAGGAVVEILGTGSLGVATRNDLDAWITTYNLTVTTMIDVAGQTNQTLTAFGRRERAAIVEIPSMKVVWYYDGDITGGQNDPTRPNANSIIVGVPQMHTFLGK